jgi:hypothetical protein
VKIKSADGRPDELEYSKSNFLPSTCPDCVEIFLLWGKHSQMTDSDTITLYNTQKCGL